MKIFREGLIEELREKVIDPFLKERGLEHLEYEVVWKPFKVTENEENQY